MRLPDPERSRAVLIGTSSYTDEELPDLPVVRRTVADLASALTDWSYGILDVPHCTVLLDGDDLIETQRALKSAAQSAEDLLLVYYVGHGLIGARRHDLHLGLKHSELEDPELGSLSFDRVRDIVLDSPAASKVIILDCCFSGRALNGTMTAPAAVVSGQIEVAGSYVLTSSQRNQVSLVLDGEEHTAFTGRLLRLLREGVPDGPELLGLDELYRELARTMKAEGLPTPLKRVTRTAELLALGRNRAQRAATWESRYAAAVALCEEARFPEAVEELRSLLAEQGERLGADHEHALRVRALLAHAMGGAGDPRAAVAELEEVLARQTWILRTGHQDTLRTRQFLAVNLGESGNRQTAIRMLRALLIDRRRELGPEDEHTLRTTHVLAHNLARAGEEAEAAELLRELVGSRRRVLGEDHPHTLRAERDLEMLRERAADEMWEA
ncbi:caspase, EACC1-associated type [Streptomyces sp. P1-3]|uniref:caspase family protein n=1 Tax=Streptomyces sp. P1-3 TaxID=3421658 RepID=UPI003D36B38B